MSDGYTIKHRDEFERMEGSGESTWLLARKALGTDCFGYNLVEIGPGGEIPEHDESGSRFFAPVDGGEAFLGYERAGPKTLDFQHTIVPPQARGQGVGEALVVAAFDYARESGQRVIPSCAFVRGWLAEHPEARDLVAA